jgi:dimeric dUTPase (all-alpha-NTP-PPase superfamily)
LQGHFDPQAADRWLNDSSIAASNKLEELRDCTFWKHGCSEAQDGEYFKINDLQNARVEVIDLLFFWVSMTQCVGLGAEEVHQLYLQKLSINHKRQDTSYSMKSKDEADNKAVTLDK